MVGDTDVLFKLPVGRDKHVYALGGIVELAGDGMYVRVYVCELRPGFVGKLVFILPEYIIQR